MLELVKDIFTINYYEKKTGNVKLCDLEDLANLVNLYKNIDFDQTNMTYVKNHYGLQIHLVDIEHELITSYSSIYQIL